MSYKLSAPSQVWSLVSENRSLAHPGCVCHASRSTEMLDKHTWMGCHIHAARVERPQMGNFLTGMTCYSLPYLADLSLYHTSLYLALQSSRSATAARVFAPLQPWGKNRCQKQKPIVPHVDVSGKVPGINSKDGQVASDQPCLGRAIRCDRARPNCSNCTHAKRKCQWYGLRLSWPRDNDRRRAIVSKPPRPSHSAPTSADQISEARFVHTSHWDIELYNNLAASSDARTLPLLDVPIIWDPSDLDISDRDLLDYCT